MSTRQMYVGRGNNVPFTEQTAKNAASTANSSLVATGKALRPLLDTLQSMQDWAIRSMQYVKPRGHLTRDQKQFLNQILEQTAYRWHETITKYQRGEKEIQTNAVESEIERYLNLQAKLNKFAWYYEFPHFPLPEHIVQPFGFEPSLVDLDYNKNPDNLEAILYYGGGVRMDSVYSLTTIKPDDLLFVTYRYDYKHPRGQNLGWFKYLDGNRLVIQDSRDEDEPYFTISMYEVVHIHVVKWISPGYIHE